MAAAANVQHHPAPAAPVMFSVGPQTAVGAVPAQGGTQFSAQGGTVYGTFGSRTLGQSFVPSPSTFGGGIQTSPTGSFLYAGRTDGSAAFATPWRQFNAGAAGPAAQPAYGTAGPQSPAPEEFGGPATDEMNPWPMNAGEGLSALEQVLGMTAGLEPPAALRMAPQAAVARPQPYARSPELSALMTRIARSKNMLASQGIDVYVSNNVARLQGAVRTPAAGVLLANVLALEPQVWQIDNQLVVEGSGTPASK
jgi:hypothetical protein